MLITYYRISFKVAYICGILCAFKLFRAKLLSLKAITRHIKIPLIRCTSSHDTVIYPIIYMQALINEAIVNTNSVIFAEFCVYCLPYLTYLSD